ncbi:MAG: response regulator, partial [Burkholderiaceae bacterium]|nr:response regulator [Burkholderiaceae bacterium]
SNDELQCVLLRADSGLLALSVDQVVGIEEIVIKPNAEPLARVRNVAGFAILSTGQVCVVLNPFDLQRSIGVIGRQAGRPDAAPTTDTPRRKQRILLAEDSMTTRTQERRILEAAGYEVETAVDGLDAWNKLSRAMFDAVVSDVNMPRMSGLELTAKIRADRRHAELPVVLVTSLASEADRRGGLEAGADAYITKPGFDQTVLLDSLARLI